jgi:two-component system CheB/CheR fusion protein
MLRARKESNSSGKDDAYIIAIGASAGGLDSITHFFDNVPGNTGVAYIVIQHLSPDHKSMMAEILSKHTSMPVFEATEDLLVQPDQIYLIPTKKLMTIEDGRLKLQEKIRSNLPNSAIDVFFDSLAKEKGSKSVAIIMSGTGTDGTRGIESIKKVGGTVVVQDPYTAEFNGMPQSAIDSGFADLIVPPDIMPENLFEFLKEAPLIQSLNVLDEVEEKRITGILQTIFQETSHDFSDYKRPTIVRRLSKRMAEKGIKTLEEYYNFILRSKEEARHLYNEFLINVTSFFRDQEAF